jgi:ketosteroid isomerase-like protein
MDTDRAALLERDQGFFDALVAADRDRLEGLLADDFLLVAIDDGSVVDRTTLLDLVAAGAVRFLAIEVFHDEAIVRRVGNVGLVVGRTGMNFTDPDGVAFSSGSRYTHVYAEDAPGRWRLTSAQGTAIKPRT